MVEQITVLKIEGTEKLYAALRGLLAKTEANIPIVLTQAGQIGVSYCKIDAPVDTGRLRASIGNPSKSGIFDVTRNSVAFGTAVEYAFDVEFGTKPHIIKPGEKGFLAWKDKKTKKWVYTRKEVHHPGTKGQYYMLRGVQAAVPGMIQVLKGVIKG